MTASARGDYLGRILDIAFDEIYIFSAESLNFIEVSTGARRNLGYDMAELATMTPFDIKPDLTPDAWRSLIRPLERGEEKLIVFEARHRRKDGSYYPVELRLQLLAGESPPVFIAIVHDISQRQRTEQALRSSEKRFRALVEQSPFGIQVLSPDGRTLMVNQAWEAMTGATLDALRDYNLLHDEQLVRKGIMPAIEKAFAGEAVQIPPIAYNSAETPQVKVPETTFCTRAHLYPIKDDDGQIREVILMHEDVSEQQRAESALRASEQRFHILAQVSPVGIFRTDAVGSCVYVNERWCEMAGLAPEDAAGEGWARALHPEDRTRVFQEWQRAALSRRPFRTECRFQRPDGTITWLLAQAAAEHDAQGEVIGYVGTITDITERKRSEEAIRHIASGVSAQTGEEFFNSLVTHLTKIFHADYAFVGICEGQHRIRTIAVCDHGRRAENFIYDLAHTPCANVLDQGTCSYPENVQSLFPRDQLLKTLGIESYIGTPLFDQQGEALGLIVILDNHAMEDIGWIQPILEIFAARTSAELERLRALAELERHRDSLEEMVRERTAEVQAQAMIIEGERAALAYANRELESFAYSVSHDLRAPLRAINGFSQALVEDYSAALDGEGQDYLRRIRAASRRMGHLIDDLLMLSRVSRQELQGEEITLSAMAEEILAELAASTPARRAEVLVEPGLRARGDPQLLRVVMENLLGNAWKYTSKKDLARIEFGTLRHDGEAVYYVRDNGAGFDMRYADKLFVAFQRLHHADEYEGSGIGLATVARIIHRHGGRIWGEGESGRGATFYFALPRETEGDAIS